MLALVIVAGVGAPVFAAEGGAEDPGWGALIAKVVNFAVLVGALVYFLKGLIVRYLKTRSETIRKDLTDAAALRATADAQLTAVRARLATLPAELDALRKLGQEELASERVRMKEATTRERGRLLERTTRDIDMQFRTARRKLLEHVAELSMARTKTRIERDITADDQARLIERYTTGVRP